jgi:glycosyltransferase involved in cell wall biosynthesis
VVGADLARRFEVAGVASRKLVIVRSAATLPAPPPGSVPSVPGVPDGRPVVLCLGALEARKNPLDLVPLLAGVHAQIPDAFLAIAGEGPLAAELEQAVARAGLTDDVAMLGFVRPVEPLLWRSDALVLLSNAEGLPQVLIQAAAAGLPFVTYDVDGGREVVALGAVGQVVPLGDVAGAAAALTRLLGAPSSRQRRVDVSSWDPTVIAASYRSVVDDILQEARRAG